RIPVSGRDGRAPARVLEGDRGPLRPARPDGPAVEDEGGMPSPPPQPPVAGDGPRDRRRARPVVGGSDGFSRRQSEGGGKRWGPRRDPLDRAIRSTPPP